MYDRISKHGLNYDPYRLGRSRLSFRGPEPDLSGPYCAFLGSTETYGKFIAQPYPAMLQGSLGMPCANFGCVNAGVDVFLNDSALHRICSRARVTVVAVMGAHNLSNRYYSVHPRRNDRFVRASALLKSLYPHTDFTEFHFTRHMLSALRQEDALHFDDVVTELQSAWIARMRRLVQCLGAHTILFHIAEAPAPDLAGELGPEPLFVTPAMIDELRPVVSDVVECHVPSAAPPARTAGMIFGELEEAAARGMLPLTAHAAAAEALIGPLRSLAA